MPGGGHQGLGKATGPAKKMRPRPRLAHLLGRSRSIRGEPGEVTPKSASRHRVVESDDLSHHMNDPGLKTAPLHHEGDRSFREMVTSTIRNRSADRQRPAGSENGSIASSKEYNKSHGPFSSSFKDGTGVAFLSNLKSSGTKAADGIGKAGKGIFGKFSRHASGGEKETPADEHYVCSVITLPLVEQTRLTRISKRLEQSRDKTEFWMPALPWRCIEYVEDSLLLLESNVYPSFLLTLSFASYLNYKGCEAEGLYRVPGSGIQIKQWQRRFDTGEFLLDDRCFQRHLTILRA